MSSPAAQPTSIYSREAARTLTPRTIQVNDASLEHFGLATQSGLSDLPTIWTPNPGPQTLFLQSTAREVLIGGAVAGGKSDGLIMGALRWVYSPGYRAVILRRERDDLRETIDRAREVYGACCPGVDWIEDRKRFEFPNGANVLMGHAQYERDIEAFKTFQFSYIAFDELTTFTKGQYVYMLSRNRAKASAAAPGQSLPLHVRSGTNPDGPGHEWVYNRFVRDREPYRIYSYEHEIERPDGSVFSAETTRQFIPSTVFDNPHVGDLEGYIAGLRSMGAELSDALLYGKWDYFKGQMFPYELAEVDHGLKSSTYFIVRCMDYGWTNPSVIYWLIVYPTELDENGLPLVEVLTELVVSETSVDGIARLVRAREEDHQAKYGIGAPRFSVIDPSTDKSEGTSGGKNIREMLTTRGVWFTRANNDRQSGWAQVRRFLSEGRLQVWRGRAPYLRETLPKLVRDPGKADDLRPKQNDHGADTLRYGLMEVVAMLSTTVAAAQGFDPKRQDPVWPELVKRLQQQGPGGSFGAGF